MKPLNATLRLFHSQDPGAETQSPVSAHHEERSSGVAPAHPVREPDYTAHDQRVSGHWEVRPRADLPLETPRSLPSIRAMAHALAVALTERSESVDASEWRLRVAAAQARAIEDILAGVDE